MKKIVIALMLLLPFGLLAQEVKFGHINKSAVLEMMPEADDAQRQLEDMNLKYRMQIKAMEELKGRTDGKSIEELNRVAVLLKDKEWTDDVNEVMKQYGFTPESTAFYSTKENGGDAVLIYSK